MPAKDSRDSVRPEAPSGIRGPELVIGLVGPIGTDLPGVGRAVEETLREVGYTYDQVKLSQQMSLVRGFGPYPPDLPVDERYDLLMNKGTSLREALKRGDALALLAIAEIRERRLGHGGDSKMPVRRHAYVLDSLKNPEEVHTLRSVYGDAFFLIAAYTPRARRVDRLAVRIAESHHSAQVNEFRDKAEYLVNRDETERHPEGLGQNVQDVFPLADAFVDASKPAVLTASIQRTLRLLFSFPYHTPRPDEQGIFFASAAACRSSSLARQVGAAISSPDGALVAIGTNEVPKAGGGMYWEGDDEDDRDFLLKADPSDLHKRRLVADVLKKLKDHNWLSEERSSTEIDALVSDALKLNPRGPLRGAGLMDVLEFVRAAHAEMAAITDAARRGISIAEHNLYVTTFPCHECARLIVASGIRRVVYVEPYPKSLAAELYPKAIQIEEGTPQRSGVLFEPFVGIAPRRYMSLFEMREAKKDRTGAVIAWDARTAVPRVGDFPAHIFREDDFITDLTEALEAAGLRTVAVPDADSASEATAQGTDSASATSALN